MRPRAIIPCAGFGTRMKMRPDQSKELLEKDGRPLIDFSIDVARRCEFEPLVVTRKEKKDLINYCIKRNVSIQVLEAPGQEWASTVLQSRRYWGEYNALILPDTQWENPEVLEEMHLNLKMGNYAAFGVHNVDDQAAWSTINNYAVTEKPRYLGPGVAWGVIAFRKHYGMPLFMHLSTKDYPFNLKRSSFHALHGFRDVTREPWHN